MADRYAISAGVGQYGIRNILDGNTVIAQVLMPTAGYGEKHKSVEQRRAERDLIAQLVVDALNEKDKR